MISICHTLNHLICEVKNLDTYVKLVHHKDNCVDNVVDSPYITFQYITWLRGWILCYLSAINMLRCSFKMHLSMISPKIHSITFTCTYFAFCLNKFLSGMSVMRYWLPVTYRCNLWKLLVPGLLTHTSQVRDNWDHTDENTNITFK